MEQPCLHRLREAQEALNSMHLEQAREILTEVLTRMQEINDSAMIIKAYQMLGFVCSRLKDQKTISMVTATTFNEAVRRDDKTFLAMCHGFRATEYIHDNQLEEAVNELNESLKLVEGQNKPQETGKLRSTLAQVYFRQNDLIRASQEIEQAINLLELDNDSSPLKRACNTATAIFLQLCDFNRALKYGMKSLELEERSTVGHGIRVTLLNLGLVYQRIGNLNKAKQFYMRAVESHDPSDNGTTLAKVYNNLGTIATEENQVDLAINFYQKALELKERLGDAHSTALACLNLGVFFLNQKGFLPQARQQLQKALELFNGLDQVDLAANSTIILAKIDLLEGDQVSARQKLADCQKVVNSLQNITIRMDILEHSSELLADLGEYHLAYVALLAHQELYKAQMNEEKIRALQETETRFAVEEAERDRTIARQQAEIFHLENIDLTQRVEDEIRKRLQQQEIIIQKSKLESIGRMAASMAHEMGQPLSIIAFGNDIIQQNLQRAGQLDEKIDDILKETRDCVRQMHTIIDNVRTFSRDQKDSVFEQVDVNYVVERALSMCQRQLEAQNISLIIDCRAGGIVLGNIQKLQQVLINLIANGQDAVIEKAGQTEFFGYRKCIEIRTMNEADKILIEVADNGGGIPQENLERVFEPFFTTKSESAGTGLGLSICYGIISEMKGTITATNRSGGGTSMQILLPNLN